MHTIKHIKALIQGTVDFVYSYDQFIFLAELQNGTRIETDTRATLSHYIINNDEVHLRVFFPPEWYTAHQVAPPQFDGDIVVDSEDLEEG